MQWLEKGGKPETILVQGCCHLLQLVPLCGTGACGGAAALGSRLSPAQQAPAPGVSLLPGSVTALLPRPGEQQEQSHCHRAEQTPAAHGVFPGRVPGQQGCVPGPAGLSLLSGTRPQG